MPDEPVLTVPSETSSADQGNPAGVAPPAPVLTFEQINEALKALPPDQVKKLDRVVGTAGELAKRIADQQIATREAQWRADQERSAREAEEERLRQLRRQDPLAYADEQERRDAALQAQREAERQMQDIAEAVGSSLQEIPEWQEVTPEQFERVQKAVAGKTGKELFKAFNAAAQDVLSDIRAAKRAQVYREKELAAEREAVRKEEAAKLMAEQRGPDMARPSANRGVPAEPPLSDFRAYNAWYDKHILGNSR